MYSFEPSEDQKTLIQAVRKYATSELRGQMREADENGILPRRLLESGWTLGLTPASIPESYGGFGSRSAVTGVLAAEELAWGDLAGAVALMTPGLIAFPLLTAGTSEQKDMLLPLFCSDAYIPGSAALMEPRYDFDPGELRTCATESDGGYVLEGLKCNVPLADESGWMLVYAALAGRTQAFLVPRNAPGLIVREREQNMGLRACPLYAVALKGCRIPASQRLGGEAGCDFQALLNASRVAQSALALGVARGAYEYALEYARTRRAFGEAIGQRQSIAFMLAEMITDLEAARLMVWEAAWLLDQGRDATREAFLAKNFVDDMAVTECDRAVQILGGHGYIRDYPVELWLRNSRGFAVLEGIAQV